MSDQNAEGRADVPVVSGAALHRPGYGWPLELDEHSLDWVGCE